MKKLSYDTMVTYMFYILLGVTAILDIWFRDGVKIPRILLIFVTVIGMRIFFRVTFFKKTKVTYLSILIFIFFSMYLANVLNFYSITNYDKVLHFASGFLIAIIGFSVFVYLFGSVKNNSIRPIAVLIFVNMFCISAAGVWEIWEFTTDQLFGLQAQNGLFDTMYDIILGSLSGVIMSIPIYMYARGKKIKFLDNLVREIIE